MITLPSFSASQVNRAEIDVKGNINNIFDSRNTMCDLEFRINEISMSWLSEILKEFNPDILLPEYKTLTVNGTLYDSLRSPKFTVKLISDLGRIDVDGSFDFNNDKFSIKSNVDQASCR